MIMPSSYFFDGLEKSIDFRPTSAQTSGEIWEIFYWLKWTAFEFHGDSWGGLNIRLHFMGHKLWPKITKNTLLDFKIKKDATVKTGYFLSISVCRNFRIFESKTFVWLNCLWFSCSTISFVKMPDRIVDDQLFLVDQRECFDTACIDAMCMSLFSLLKKYLKKS